MGSSYIFDIETDGLLHQMTKIHCCHLKDMATGEVLRFDKDKVSDAVTLLTNADNIIGHNIVDFDVPALKKIFQDFTPRGNIRDTYIYARVLFSDIRERDYRTNTATNLPRALIGSHSLKAYGFRYGLNKGDYADEKYTEAKKLGLSSSETHKYVWGEWSPAMSDYCALDLEVTAVLWKALVKENTPKDNAAILEEHRVSEIFGDMQNNGFPINMEKAEKLSKSVTSSRDALRAELVEHFGVWYTPAKIKERYPAYINNGTDDFDAYSDIILKMRTGKIKEFIAECAHNGVRFPKIDRRFYGQAKKRLKAHWETYSLAQKKTIMDALRTYELTDIKKFACDSYCEHNPEDGEDNKRRWWAEVKTSKINRKYKSITKTSDDGVISYNFDVSKGAKFCPIVRKEFNPGSRQQVVNRFTTVYEWRPTEFTPKGSPSVNADVLDAMDVDDEKGKYIARQLADFYFYSKLIGQVSTGAKAWLKTVGEDGISHCRTLSSGAVTGRLTHSNFNIGQVPAVTVTKRDADGTVRHNGIVLQPQDYEDVHGDGKTVLVKGRKGRFGYECRDMFEAHKGFIMCGSDLKSLEFRCLAEACVPYDDGALIDVVLRGDIHKMNQEKINVEEKGIAKRFFFALIYGAGDWKLGHTAYPHMPDHLKAAKGRELRALLMKGLPALSQAIKQVQEEAQQGYILGLDGRRLYVRSLYAALNTKLQGMGASVAKRWSLKVVDMMADEGYDHGLNKGFWALMALIHDELQSSVRPDLADTLAKVKEQAAVEVGLSFNMRCPIAADSAIGKTWKDTH